jgi:5-methylthioadenosine/S-adenosylhomocysteine deaminase
MRKTVLRGASALLGDAQTFDAAPHDICIEGDHIAAIGPAGSLAGDRIIDLSGRLLVPGLINGHFHSQEHFQKGRVENLPLELWIHYVRTPLPVPLSPRQTYLRTMIGAIESLRTGTTTVLDDTAVSASINRANLDALFQAYEDIGIRALVGMGMMNRTIVDNFPFAEEAFAPEMLARLRELKPAPEAEFDAICGELAKTRHPQQQRVGLVISLSAPQRCTEEFLRKWRRFADQHALPVVSHVQETRMQVVTGGQFYGGPMVEYLDRIGFLAPRTSLIHAVWLNPREIDALAKSGASAQHNAWSNMTLGSGVQPVRALLDAGVNVSMGSDGTCSTFTANMLNVMGAAAAVSKIRGDDYTKWLTAREALSAATRGGSIALGYGERLGSIKVGALADLVAYRLDAPSFTPLNDPVRQLVYAERGAGVDFVMVAGEPAIERGRMVKIDEAALVAEIAAEHAGLKQKFDAAEASAAPLMAAMESIYRRSLATAIPADTYPARLPATGQS